MGIIIGIIGVLLVLFGVFAFVASLMPAFGHSRDGEGAARVLGIAAFIAGIGLIFYAGTWV